MKIFESLNRAWQQPPAGSYAPYYFRAQGFQKDLGAAPAALRANGIYALFTLPQPVILPNEWIVGNNHSLYVDAPAAALEEAKGITDSFGGRTFATNGDHFAPYYHKILQIGLPALMQQIDQSCLRHRDDADKVQTLQAMRLTLQGLREMIVKYAETAARLGADGDERLSFIRQNCTAIAQHAPQTFAQALQLVWFCHVAFTMEGRFAMALGRMDQYLYPFYRADIDRGTLTDAKVTEWLENIFIRLQGDTVNICIGGQGRDGRCRINDLSRCILQAVANCQVPGPNLSLRLTADTPDDFLDQCLQSIGTGLGYPAIMNDDVNLAALKRYGYAEEDVYDYCMVGCIENFLAGKQPPWTDGRFDVPRFFDYLFNNGVSQTHRSTGLDTGDVGQIDSMQQLLRLFEQQLAHGAEEYMAWFNGVNAAIDQRLFPEPFLSCFCCDCIERGLDINNGGSRYPSVHGAATMGLGTTVDALAAIEQVVFVDGKATLTDIKNALNADFEGYEWLHRMLLDAPKYGNNDDFADKYAVWFIDCMSRIFQPLHTRDGGPVYVAAAANIANIYAGQHINATPDGRRRGEPLSDAASPSHGMDTRGVTCTLNSLCKPDYTKVACGSVVNQKFSPDMFRGEKRRKLATLIRTYFRKGGQEIQINATSREMLTDAMEHPEKYPSLVVRVSGFSAFYVTLERMVQLDILNRTQQG